MPKGLTLTLKDLVKLGVIKLKKRKRRKHRKAVVGLPVEANVVRSSSGHMTGYGSIASAVPLQAYSDHLRLRDANDQLNSHLVSQRHLLENEKAKTDDFIQKSKQLYVHLLQNGYLRNMFDGISQPNTIGYSDTDDIDVPTSAPNFHSQLDFSQGGTSPYILTNEPEEESDTIQLDRKETIRPSIVRDSATAQDDLTTPKKSKGFLGTIASLTGLSRSGKGKEPIAISDNVPYEGVAQIDEHEVDEPIGVKQGGGGSPVSSPILRRVETTKRKPTREELRKWREWYQEVAGDKIDNDVLSSPHRGKFEKAISTILLQQYKDAGGKDTNVLKSKDPNLINKKLRQLLRDNWT